jgi:hypothetical protein
MTLAQLALPAALLFAASAAPAAGPASVKLIKGGTTNPQTSVIVGGDAISDLEFDVEVGPDASGDDEDAGPLLVEGRGASVNRE